MVELQSSEVIHLQAFLPKPAPTSFNREIIRCFASMIFLVWIAFSGCSTHAKRLAQPRSLFYGGHLDDSYVQLEKVAKNSKRDRDVVALDMAMIDLLRGKAHEAETKLLEVRDRFDHLEQKSLAESAASLWTDDQVKAYAGEDYEKVFLRSFLALSSLLQDGSDAEAYSLQVNEKQHQLAERAAEKLGKEYAEKYAPVPLGFYLRGVLREETKHDYDDALRAYQQTAELLPTNPTIGWDVSRSSSGVHSAPGHGVLYVFALVGRGPSKIEVEEHATSDALLIADRIVSAAGPYSVPPTLAPIKLPAIQTPACSIDGIGVEINGQVIGPTTMLTDVAAIAESTFDVKRKELMARAVARRVIKKATVYAAKDSMGQQDPWASLAMDAAGVLWEASESAETRCWGLLPREIQILRVELPRGKHQLQLAPIRSGRPIGARQSTSVTIEDGRNTYALCYYPDAVPIGNIQVSKR